MNKLPILEIFVFAFVFSMRNLKQLLRIALVPLVIGTICFSAISYFSNAEKLPVSFVLIGWLLLSVFCGAIIVSWHRFVLLGAAASDRSHFPYFQKRDFRFCLYIFCLVILFSIGELLVVRGWGLLFVALTELRYEQMASILPNVADYSIRQIFLTIWHLENSSTYPQIQWYFYSAPLIWLSFIYWVCHWLLIIPAMTMDIKYVFKNARTLVKNNRFRFYTIVVSVYSVLWVTEFAVESLISWVIASPDEIIGQWNVEYFKVWIQVLFSLLTAVIFASGLSESYRKLKRITGAREEALETS
ncbi:MAG: hypothetical protein GKS01_03535 [Alphaproteobacteria bacterium]|nr:hypothetical protein [Alphaproteobacteria bacterium]